MCVCVRIPICAWSVSLFFKQRMNFKVLEEKRQRTNMSPKCSRSCWEVRVEEEHLKEAFCHIFVFSESPKTCLKELVWISCISVHYCLSSTNHKWRNCDESVDCSFLHNYNELELKFWTKDKFSSLFTKKCWLEMVYLWGFFYCEKDRIFSVNHLIGFTNPV